MRRTTSAALALVIAASAMAGLAAHGDPSELVDCTPEDDATLVVEGEAFEETVTGAAFTYPYGEFDAIGVDEPTGGAFQDQYQVHVPVAYKHIDGNRPSATVEIAWDQPSDIDLDVLDADGNVVGEDHAFNVNDQNFTATVAFAPDACTIYTIVINNSYAIPAQDVHLATTVTSKAPRSHH